MPRWSRLSMIASVLIVGSLWAPASRAATLQVAPDAPIWMHVGADVLLWLHIGGGAAGIVTGFMALASRKGGRIHRTAGKAFFGAMLVCYLLAAAVAPFLDVEQRTNTVAGLMALYLLLSGWQSAQQPQIKAGPWQVGGLAAALGIAGVGALFMLMGASSPTGTVDGAPPQAFIVFTIIGAAAAAGEINVLVRGSIGGAARLSRHLWRMCGSLFIASGSFLLGQMQLLPGWVTETGLNVVLALAPVALMLGYLVLVRLPKRPMPSIARR